MQRQWRIGRVHQSRARQQRRAFAAAVAWHATRPESTAETMNLAPDQRGALVINVASGGPADQAGLQGSQNQATIDGSQTPVGGDVITAVDKQPVTGMDEVIDYLFTSKQPGDKITLTVLRNGRQQDVTVTLGQRPANPNQ